MKKRAPDSIDWNELWKQAKSKRTFRSKKPEDWDRKAPSFARRNSSSLYIEKFLQLLQPQSSWTVLDIGCGPGTLAIPLAKKVKSISGLDFSPKMLEILTKRAKKQKLTNILTHCLSWTDSWEQHGIQVHDIAIASRSLSVDDLRPALEKMDRFARKKVILTDRVGYGPFDPEAFSAVGRKLETGPDYTYTINLLYQMGIHASVDFIELEDSLPCSSLDEAIELYSWMFHNLTAEEKKQLKKYVQSITTSANNGTCTVHRKHVPTWAFICWKPEKK